VDQRVTGLALAVVRPRGTDVHRGELDARAAEGGGDRGELIEEAGPVVRLQKTYDAVRDLALTPAESRKFILRLLEEATCDPST
jgi:hypothetical protein